MYLAMGMSPSDYWEGDCALVKAYREADRLRQERANMEAWLQGMYIYEAVACLSPILQAFAPKGTRAKPYRDKPYELFASSKKTDEDRMRDGIDWMEQFAKSFNKKFERRKRGDTSGDQRAGAEDQR